MRKNTEAAQKKRDEQPRTKRTADKPADLTPQKNKAEKVKGGPIKKY